MSFVQPFIASSADAANVLIGDGGAALVKVTPGLFRVRDDYQGDNLSAYPWSVDSLTGFSPAFSAPDTLGSFQRGLYQQYQSAMQAQGWTVGLWQNGYHSGPSVGGVVGGSLTATCSFEDPNSPLLYYSPTLFTAGSDEVEAAVDLKVNYDGSTCYDAACTGAQVFTVLNLFVQAACAANDGTNKCGPGTYFIALTIDACRVPSSIRLSIVHRRIQTDLFRGSTDPLNQSAFVTA
jgi:hypothetical protein